MTQFPLSKHIPWRQCACAQGHMGLSLDPGASSALLRAEDFRAESHSRAVVGEQ